MCSVSDPVLPSVLWLVVVGSLASWLYGFGTGSNDVANAFGTSVGAKTITLRQAVLIASVFEFVGAMVLGRVSTATIAGGIADINAFLREPEVFAYGMVCAMTVAGIWQILASYLELNVSSTHSIIGCIIGFSLVYAGGDAVLWRVRDDASFPPYKGVIPIVVSWFFSPIAAAIVSAVLFLLIRTLVLRRANAYTLSFWLLPPFVTLTVFICIYFVFTKGIKKTLTETEDDTWTDAKSAWVSAVIAAGMGVLTAAILLPILKKRSDTKFNPDGTPREATPSPRDVEKAKAVELAGSTPGSNIASTEAYQLAGEPAWKVYLYKAKKALSHGTDVDIHAVVEEDELVGAIHRRAEVFDPKAEHAFKYLQVFSAICVVFAHGAGEVGYMAGPLAAIWQAYTEGKVIKNVKAPAWIVLIGATGLVVGLATYGYKVTRAMGVRLAKLTATRGFCAELSTAFVILIASQYGLPTSSSQVVTGGIIGVGLCEGVVGVNWRFFGRQFASWIGTLFISGLCTAALFSCGYFAPGYTEGQAQLYYEDQVSALSQSLLENYRISLMSYQAASAAGVIPRLPPATLLAWNNTLGKLAATAKSRASGAQGTVYSSELVGILNTGLSLYQTDTILTVGQTKVFPGAPVCNSNIPADITAGAVVPCPAPKLLPAGTPPSWPPA